MKTENKYQFFVVGLIILTVLVGLYSATQQSASASAPSGLPATVRSMTSFTVTTAALQIAATSSCAARIVSTSASPVMLGFSAYAGTTTTGSVGLLQAASTTVAYDSGIYGCNQMSAFSYTSGLVTVVETN